MKQFILWHKKDIVLNVTSPTLSDVHLDRADQDGHVYSPARGDDMTEVLHSSFTPWDHMPNEPHTSLARQSEQGHDEMPQHSLACHINQGHDHVMSQPCPTKQGPNDLSEPSEQAPPIPKQGLPSEKENERTPVFEAQKKIPIHTRPMFEPMKYVSYIDQWFAHA
jgi:hypothetical protein